MEKKSNWKFQVYCCNGINDWSCRITPEDVMKTVWKKILVWFWDLQYKNALAENEGMLRRFREIGSG
jgi:hypothetical protein